MRLDPRTRLLGIPLLFLPPLVMQAPAYLLPIAAVTGLWLWRAGGGPRLRAALPLIGVLMLSSLVLWSFFVKGQTPLWGPFTVEAVVFGSGMGLRLCAFTLIGLLYLTLSPVEETAWALNRLGMPFAVSFAIVSAFRLMERTARTAQTVFAAQTARGLKLDEGSILHRIRAYIPLMVPVLVLSLRRVDLMAMAMESRAFGAKCRRTSLLDFRMRAADWLTLIVCLLVATGAVWLRLHGHGVLIPGRL
ncbi:MAG: energy-coupling factor transporter transmembrane protein EcfT [Armatimonadetes bacterium]|nr:energy-coupling factor transporter transmembrane protein EcfT [Armatimonadota bacterium]